MRLNLDDLMLKRAVGAGQTPPGRQAAASTPEGRMVSAVKSSAQSKAADVGTPVMNSIDGPVETGVLQSVKEAASLIDAAVEADDSTAQQNDAAETVPDEGAVLAPAIVPREDSTLRRGLGAVAEKQGRAHVGLAKKYGPGFVWGQLNGWYKQTVFDPTASLSAERRGTISLPDIESCYGGGRSRYTLKVRGFSILWFHNAPHYGRQAVHIATHPFPFFSPLDSCSAIVQDRSHLIDHIEKRPDAMWKIGTVWSFRNEAKVYGSPMFDAVWAHVMPNASPDPMPVLLQHLRSAPLPKPTEPGRLVQQPASAAENMF